MIEFTKGKLEFSNDYLEDLIEKADKLKYFSSLLFPRYEESCDKIIEVLTIIKNLNK